MSPSRRIASQHALKYKHIGKKCLNQKDSIQIANFEIKKNLLPNGESPFYPLNINNRNSQTSIFN